MHQTIMLKTLKLKASMKTTRPLELKPKKDVLFIIGDWNAKVGSQETPGVTGKFGLGQSIGVSASASAFPRNIQD